MKIVSFDMETSNVFDLRPGEDIDKYAPFDVAVAATQVHGGEHRLWFSPDAGGRPRVNLERQHAQELLQYLEQMQRTDHATVRAYRRYRNGTTLRRLTLGCGTVDLKLPRVRDVPPDLEAYESKSIRKEQRRSDTSDETVMKLFIEGLDTRDFEPALRMLVGELGPLSPSTSCRWTQKVNAEDAAFEQQDRSIRKYVFVWADGIYLKAGAGTEKVCRMVLIGTLTDG